ALKVLRIRRAKDQVDAPLPSSLMDAGSFDIEQGMTSWTFRWQVFGLVRLYLALKECAFSHFWIRVWFFTFMFWT
ncbi:MAG: hypothetical protein AAGK26_11440, partial [Pseudomonadota bacterium]